MKVQTTGNVMILGVSSREYEGKLYYSADVYDSESGNTYRCGINNEAFSALSNVAKPAPAKALALDIQTPYQGRCRLSLLGWS